MLLVPLLIALMLSIGCGISEADVETSVEAKEIANANIIHAIATIESKYNSSLNTALSEGIDSLNQALNSLDGIEVIGVEVATVSPIFAHSPEPLPTSIPLTIAIAGFDRLITYTLPTNNQKQVYKVFTKDEDDSPIAIIDLFINQTPSNNYPSDNHAFLNITDRVHTDGANNGLLSLALDSQYQNNGYFYLNYTALTSKNTIVSRVSRFTRNAENPLVANTESEFILLEIPLP
jgi:hypothetical protein